jgi:hypothetical protein
LAVFFIWVLRIVCFYQGGESAQFPGGTKGEKGKVVFGRITKGLNEQVNMAVIDLISKMPDWEPATRMVIR